MVAMWTFPTPMETQCATSPTHACAHGFRSCAVSSLFAIVTVYAPSVFLLFVWEHSSWCSLLSSASGESAQSSPQDDNHQIFQRETCSDIVVYNIGHAVQALMFAMHRSAQDMHTSTTPILQLMSAGASVAVRNKSGLSALMIACTSTSAGLWKLLVHITQKDIVIQVCTCTCRPMPRSILWMSLLLSDKVVATCMHLELDV